MIALAWIILTLTTTIVLHALYLAPGSWKRELIAVTALIVLAAVCGPLVGPPAPPTPAPLPAGWVPVL